MTNNQFSICNSWPTDDVRGMKVMGMRELNKIICGFIPLTNIPLTSQGRDWFGWPRLGIGH
jgi:hypothetical protein